MRVPRWSCHYHRSVVDDDAATPDSGSVRAVSRVPQKVQSNTGWTVRITLLIAVIAVGLAVWALLRSPAESPTAAGSPGGGDPKARVCAAANTVATAVSLQTNADVGPEPAAIEAVAGNARLAMLGGGTYLVSQISADTPSEVADAAQSFGDTLQAIGIHALSGVDNSDPVQADRIKAAETSRNKLAEVCAK